MCPPKSDRDKPITLKDISEMKALLQPILDREKQAEELAPFVPPANLFFGISGVSPDFDSFDVLGGFACVRKVTNPPEMVHVCSAAKLELTDFMGVSRYSPGIQAEIACGTIDPEEDIDR
jgi:hypothetical protein